MSDPKNPNQINIELNEEVAQGTYSNLAVITHSSFRICYRLCSYNARNSKGTGEIEDNPHP